MSADSPRRSSGSRCIVAATVPPQVVSDRSILDSAIGFINDVTLTSQPYADPKDTITWARFETSADISDPRYGDDWELEGNVAPPLLLVLGYGLGVQVWAIPANGEAVEVLSWRHGIVSALRILPTPTTCVTTYETHGRADEIIDLYAEKRPLIAIVDGSTSAGAQPQFCSVNFVSLKTGTQVKTIKFKNPVLDILANRTSIVMTFHERIAVFDARTLEDRLSITTCFPSPGINPNPVALGPRWLAYAEHKLLHSKRSAGGCDGEAVASYTATVLNAAKSLGKGLLELGEQVAAGLTGSTGSIGSSKNNSFDSQSGIEAKQPGFVTILDIKYPIKDYSPTTGTPMSGQAGTDPIVAHFTAHSEAVVAMDFDNSGMLLVTADRRGHDFHIFRIQPHPVGSSLAAVHHLYILHRGDTTAKVQNITFSLDARWVAVSTLRGTTHVFPITPYGGPMGVRTHTSIHVVNKLSRFHRSAGLSADGRSSSPITHSESTTFTQSLQPYHNPTLPPFPRPTVVQPLAQLRQPFALGSPPGSAGLSIGVGSNCGNGGNVGTKSGSGGSSSSQRQRHSSLSDENGKPLSVCAIFAKSRSWLLEPPNVTREAPHRIQRKAVDSLFVMAGHGALIQYDLDTKLASNVAKEKICDDTPIELEVEAKAQWNLGRGREGSQELMPPLPSDNWLIRDRYSCVLTDSTRQFDDSDDRGESWLSQVEIITHAGPHRRLWMGPQFVFKTYNAPSGSNLSHVDAEAVEIGVSKATTAAALTRAGRSSPLSIAGRSAVPVLIESGSYSSIEQSPKLMDRFRHDHLDSDFSIAHGDTRLKEDLADAMRETPSVPLVHKDTGRLLSSITSTTTADRGTVSHASDMPTFYDALAEHEQEIYTEKELLYAKQTSFNANRSHSSMASAVALASVLPNISSYDTSSGYESFESFRKPKQSIEKIVNPLGTVTTITAGMSAQVKTDMLDEVVSKLASEGRVIHENCDEALFRPVVAIFCDEKERKRGEEEAKRNEQFRQPPEVIGNKLIVPVIAKEVDAELTKKEKQKNVAKAKHHQQQQQATTSNSEQEKVTAKKEPLVGFDKLNDVAGCGRAKVKLAPTYKVKIVQTESKNSKKDTNVQIKPTIEESGGSCFKVTEESEDNIKNVNKKDPTAKIMKNLSSKNKAFQSDNHTGKGFELLDDGSPIKSGEVKAGFLNAADLADSLIEPNETADAEEVVKMSPKNVTKKVDSKFQILTKESEVKGKEEEQIKEEVKMRKFLKDTEEERATKVEQVDKKDKKTKAKEDKVIERKQEQREEIFPKETVTETIPTFKSKVEKEEKKLEVQKEDLKRKVIEEEYEIKEETKFKMNKKLEEKATGENEETVKVEKEQNLKPIREAFKEEKIGKEKLNVTLSTTPIGKSSKKNKKSQSSPSSNSNSEAEEIVEVKAQKVKKTKEKERRYSQSSEGSCADMEQSFFETSLTTTATKKEESMFLSFLKTEEKKHLKTEKGKNKEQETEKLKEEIIRKETIVNENKPSTKINENKFNIADLEKQRQEAVPKKDNNKGAIKKENMKSEESANKTKTEMPELPPRTPPRSPKKKLHETTDKEHVNVGKKTTSTVSVTVSPAKVITQQPTMSKNDLSGFQAVKNEISKPTNPYNDITDRLEKMKPTSTANSPQKVSTTSQSALPTSAWKTLSGADLITRNLGSFSQNTENINFPSLSRKNTNSKMSLTSEAEKLLLDLPTPISMKSSTTNITRKTSTTTAATLIKSTPIKKSNKIAFDDFSMLSPLETLPPLPALEPLEIPKSPKGAVSLLTEQVSLITFESPQQEENITSPPCTGLTDQNFVHALCGSSHYKGDEVDGAMKDDELTMPALPDLDESPFTTVAAFDIVKPKKKTNTYGDKYLSSSPCSSASEEIIVLEEKKMSKKQRRKRQQQLQEKQQNVENNVKRIVVDEELRPLIDSQIFLDTMTSSEHFGSSIVSSSAAQFLEIPTSSTTATDSSEGPMPATTSDDNISVLPTAKNSTAPNKVKTKRLEHKFNLFAAIEAATSTSNSSAEESGVEGGGGRGSDHEAASTLYMHHHYHLHPHSPLAASSLIGGTSAAAGGAMLTLPPSLSVSAQLSAAKKKTKRRKR